MPPWKNLWQRLNRAYITYLVQASGNQKTSSAAAAGMSASQSSSAVSSEVGGSNPAPAFLSVSSMGNAGFSAVSRPQQSSAAGTQSCATSTPSFVFPKDWLGFSSQFFLSQTKSSDLSIVGVLPPIPGHLATMASKNLFIDSILLRPCNIIQLPPVEPAEAQLTKLLKCDRGSELKLIRSFMDWAEAWGVFAGIMHKVNKGKVPDLISYFLLVAKMARDSFPKGVGWLDYDKLFRKKAAGNTNMSWSEYDVSLYMATVGKSSVNGALSGNASQGTSSGSSSPRPQTGVCYAFNSGHCRLFSNCKYRRRKIFSNFIFAD